MYLKIIQKLQKKFHKSQIRLKLSKLDNNSGASKLPSMFKKFNVNFVAENFHKKQLKDMYPSAIF